MPEVIALLSSSAEESDSDDAREAGGKDSGNEVTLVDDDDDAARKEDDALLTFDWRASQSTAASQASQTVASSSSSPPTSAAALTASSDSDLENTATMAPKRLPTAKARKQAEQVARKQLRAEKLSAAAKAKRAKKTLKLEEQIASGKHRTREFTVMASPTVRSTIMQLEFKLLSEERNAIVFCDVAPLDLVYFARRQVRMNEADLTLGFFEPEIDSTATLVLSAEAMLDLLGEHDGRIDGVVQRVSQIKAFLVKQGALPPFRIFIMVHTLDKAGVAPAQLAQSVTQLYMQHRIEVIEYELSYALNDGLWNMFQAIEMVPYRKDPTVLDMKRKHKRESTKVDDGIALTDVWLNMLRCVRGLATDKDKPETIVQGGFATFRSMFDEFNGPGNDQVALRTKVATLAGNGKRLAHKVASDLAVVMTSRDPDALL